MKTNRIHTFLHILAAGVLLLMVPAEAMGQFAPKNDTTSAFTAILNKYGRIETYDGTDGKYRAAEDRMIHYLMPQVGLNDTLVWHVRNATENPIKDNTYYSSADSSQFNRYLLSEDGILYPDTETMNVSMLIRLWEGENYGLVRYGVHNMLERDSASAPVPDTTFKVAVNLRAKHYNAFSSQTLEYDQESQRVYISGNGGVVAMQPLDIEPVAVRFLDDSDYANNDPNEDNAPSSARWDIMSQTESSSTLNTGENGGWAFMNFGDTPTLLPQDSTNFWMAFSHGDSREVVNRRLDSARSRYDRIMTSTPDREAQPAPSQVKLNKNYPNPFNPQTTISFVLPEPAGVNLNVYNILGQQVRTLVDQRMSSGRHRVRFNGANLASGIYFYRLQTGQTTITRRMTLIK